MTNQVLPEYSLQYFEEISFMVAMVLTNLVQTAPERHRIIAMGLEKTSYIRQSVSALIVLVEMPVPIAFCLAIFQDPLKFTEFKMKENWPFLRLNVED